MIFRRFLVFLFVSIFYVQVYPQKNDQFFGPVITYANKKMKAITLLFHSTGKETFSLLISNQYTNYMMSAKNGEWKRFRIAADSYPGFYYQVVSADRNLSEIRGWVQIPSKVGYSFAVVGNSVDIRDEYWNMAHIFGRIGQHQPAFLIHTGNVILDSLNLDRWQVFFEKGRNLFSSLAFLPAIGSLDFYSVLWRRLFDVSNDRQPFYSYSLPLAHIIVVNSSMYFSKDSSQYRWLEEELKEVNSGQWKILVIHHNPWVIVSQRGNNQKTAVILEALKPLLQKYPVNLVFTGEHAYYERSDIDGIPVINSGGLGENNYSGEIPNIYRKVLITQKPHFVIVNVTPQKLTMTAYDAGDRKLDSLILKAK